jgi:hypothetical protein
MSESPAAAIVFLTPEDRKMILWAARSARAMVGLAKSQGHDTRGGERDLPVLIRLAQRLNPTEVV